MTSRSQTRADKPPQPLRVLLLASNVNPLNASGVGGAESTIYQLCHSLDRRHFAVSLGLKCDPGPAGALLAAAGVRVHVLKKCGSFSPLFWRSLRRVLVSDQIDVALSPTAGLNFHLLLVALTLPRLACVISVHHSGQLDRRIRFIEAPLASRAAYLDVPTPYLTQALRKVYWLPGKRIVAIPNGVDTARFKFVPYGARTQFRARIGVPEDAMLLYTPSRIHPIKGQDIMIAALRSIDQEVLKRRKLIWVDTGGVQDQSLHAEMQRLAQPIAEHVRILPSTDTPQIWFAASDYVVLPSRSETQPLALLEAAAVGRPFLATRVGGVPDLVASLGGGHMVEPSNAEMLAQAILRITSESPERRAAIGDQLAGQVRAQYSIESCIRRYGELLEDAWRQHHGLHAPS